MKYLCCKCSYNDHSEKEIDGEKIYKCKSCGNISQFKDLISIYEGYDIYNIYNKWVEKPMDWKYLTEEKKNAWDKVTNFILNINQNKKRWRKKKYMK